MELNFILILLALMISTCRLYELTPEKLEIFDNYVNEITNCKKVTGGSVAIVNNRKLVYARGFGHTDVNKTREVTNSTKFCLGSLTKAFTSAVIAKLLSDHPTYTWDTPILEILGPSFYLVDDFIRSNVNLRDLLSHKVGTPSNFSPMLAGFPENTTREEFVSMLGHQTAAKPFRTEFLYSNYMYTLAGYVAEKISGKTWETLVQEILLEPLEMLDSGFVDQVKDFGQFSPAFVYVDQEVKQIDQSLVYSVSPAGPAGSIYSTAIDVAKWMNFHLNQGSTLNSTVLIPKPYFSELHRAQINTPFSDKDLYKPLFPISDMSISYDLGWVSSLYRGYRKVWHSGGIAGYSSLLWLFPDMDSGVFVTVSGAKDNLHALPLTALINIAADLLIGEEPWLNKSTACSLPEPWKPSPPTSYANTTITKNFKWNISEPAFIYTGDFNHPAFGHIYVNVEENSLLLWYGRFGKMQLFPLDEETFVGYFMDSLYFVTNADSSTKPFEIQFSFSDTGDVDGILFPVDVMQPKTFFHKKQEGITMSFNNVSNSGSAQSRTIFSLFKILAYFISFVMFLLRQLNF